MSEIPAPRGVDEWLTREELCDWLKVTKTWVWDQCEARRIPHIKLGRQLRFRRGEIEEWLDTQRVR